MYIRQNLIRVLSLKNTLDFIRSFTRRWAAT